MKFTTKTARITAVVAAASFALVGGMASSQAISVPEATPTAPANSVNTKALQNGAVTTAKVGAGQIWQTQMNPAVNDVYLKTYNNTVGKVQLKKEVADDLELGKGSVKLTVPTTTIANIGGPFAANATNVGTFTLRAGTWLVTTNAVFNRTEAATATDPKTLPQLALRYPGDAGTIMGNDISTAVGRELLGATVKTVTVTEPTTVAVYGFGYNDNGSAFASGKINVAAEITATKIG